MSIQIQKIYSIGSKCLEYECPWQIPSSVFHLDICLTKNDTVFEIGSGGSTFFFSKRCKNVISVETDNSWAINVQTKINEQKLENVTLHADPVTQNVINYINSCTENVTVISIDSHHNYNRSMFLSAVLDKFPNIKIIVLDNFADAGMFPTHHHLTLQDWFKTLVLYNNQKWCGADHEDMVWSGRGTRILTCQQPYLDKD